MASTTNKPFHTYENAVYDDRAIPSAPSTSTSNSNNNNNNHYASASQPTPISNSTLTTSIAANNNTTRVAVSKTTNTVESPFPDPHNDSTSSSSIPQNVATATILSTTDSSGTTRKLTSRAVAGQNLVTKLISFPAQSPMDSLREWSVSTFKCTKQIINEKRGLCSVTNDAQLQADIDQLRDSKDKLVQMLRLAQQMLTHYTQLVGTQRQLHSLMSEMSIKNFATISGGGQLIATNSHHNNTNHRSSSLSKGSKHIVANFSSLGNNLSSTASSSPLHRSMPSSSSATSSDHHLDEFLPILNHMQSSHLNLTEDFKKNSISLNLAIKNGDKLISALTFFCSNLSTLINKTIEDTLLTVRQFESARLEYDAERNSLNFTSPQATAQSSTTYSSDKLELARVRYEQLKEDVQIKMKFLEENTIKVMHKQLLIFNGAFASYSSGNTAALDATLREFSIR